MRRYQGVPHELTIPVCPSPLSAGQFWCRERTDLSVSLAHLVFGGSLFAGDLRRRLGNELSSLIQKTFEPVCCRRVVEGKLPPMGPNPGKREVGRIESCRDGEVNDSIHPLFRIGGNRHVVFATLNVDWDHRLRGLCRGQG